MIRTNISLLLSWRLLKLTLFGVLAGLSVHFMQSGLAWANPSLPGKGETLVDRNTGLMWQKGDSYLDLKKGLNWYEALEYVDKKNLEKFGGYNDWRLPTIEELDKLWDSSRPLKSKDGERIGLSPDFEGGGSYYLWTGNERGLDNAWYFGLGHKEHYFNLKDLGDLDQGVKMVRNPKDAKG